MTPLHYAARYGKIDSAKATEATKSEKTWKIFILPISFIEISRSFLYHIEYIK